MATVTKTFNISWDTAGTVLTDLDINLLFEIFGPFPIQPEFTMRSSLIGLGKSRVIIQNQDQLRNSLFNYIEDLTSTQQLRVKELIAEWKDFDIKVVKFATAERVRFRTSAPEEQRRLIKTRIQTYIPIYAPDELPEMYGGSGFNSFSNEIPRG